MTQIADMGCRKCWHFFWIVFILLLQAAVPFSNSQESEESGSLWESINWQTGPVIARLGENAEFRVPEGFLFAGAEDTRVLMQAMGNILSNEEIGFFSPQGMEWFVLFEFSNVGYVKDDEKDQLNADAILDSIKQSTEQSNEVREQNGFGSLTILDWEVKPHYSENTNNLEWAIRAQEAEGGLVINHNTRILGRLGIMKATLVVNSESFAETFPVYRSHMESFSFKSGQKYADFRQGDKIAKYGLTALVAGGAAAVAVKSGLLKYIWKILVVVAIGGGAFFKRLFGRKSVPTDLPSDTPIENR